jgi:hypothetical protein
VGFASITGLYGPRPTLLMEDMYDIAVSQADTGKTPFCHPLLLNLATPRQLDHFRVADR